MAGMSTDISHKVLSRTAKFHLAVKLNVMKICTHDDNYRLVVVVVSILFSQGGPFSSEADIQRGPGLKKRYKISL